MRRQQPQLAIAKHVLVALAWAGGGLVVAAAATGDQGRDISREFRYLMGTSVEVRAAGGTAEVRAEAIGEAFGAMAEVDRVMSNWRAESEITAANRDAPDFDVRLSDPLFSVIQAGQLTADRSGGAFDMTVGPAVKLWGFRSRKPHAPTADELAAIRSLVNYRNVILDSEKRTMRFVRPGMEIDLGGIAKGFAVEIAADVLRRRGLSGFIDAGGTHVHLVRNESATDTLVTVAFQIIPQGAARRIDAPKPSQCP
jgi:thiamine biosynthesis lipoprotein